MKKFFVLCIVSFLCFGTLALAKTEEVKSTQGVELDASISKTIKQQAKEDNKAYKKEKKAKKQYIKNVSNIKKMRERKRLQQRNLEFLNSRLNIKKQKLEELQKEKGENK